MKNMENKYAIIKDGLVINLVLATAEFAQEQGWVDCPDYVDDQAVSIGWGYANGQFIPPDYSEQNKANATALLQETDWTCTVDITDPQYSNPYLMNQNEFLAYRSQVRDIALNPPTTPAVFPPMPAEIWSEEQP